MTAWTICKGIPLAVGILFVGIPLAALGSALPLLIGSAWVWRHAGEGREP